MSRYLRASVGCLLVFLSACGDSPTAPEGAVLGRWGGDGAELIAEAARVQVILSCNALETRDPLIPGGHGRFAMPVVRKRHRTPAAVVLRGVVSGSRIDLEVIAVTPDTTFSAEYTVFRDQPAMLNDICAANA